MEQEQASNNTAAMQIPVLAVLVLVIIGVISYLMWSGTMRLPFTQEPRESEMTEEIPAVVEYTQKTAEGLTPAPAGFPQDIPVEQEQIFESLSITYPGLSVKQLSVSYLTSKEVSEKYAEYRNYLTSAGYWLSEGISDPEMKSVTGVKEDSQLLVVVSNQGSGVMVQLAYLIK